MDSSGTTRNVADLSRGYVDPTPGSDPTPVPLVKVSDIVKAPLDTKGPTLPSGVNPNLDEPLPALTEPESALKKEPQPWSMQDLVSYNPNVIVGRYWVIASLLIFAFCPLEL